VPASGDYLGELDIDVKPVGHQSQMIESLPIFCPPSIASPSWRRRTRSSTSACQTSERRPASRPCQGRRQAGPQERHERASGPRQSRSLARRARDRQPRVLAVQDLERTGAARGISLPSAAARPALDGPASTASGLHWSNCVRSLAGQGEDGAHGRCIRGRVRVTPNLLVVRTRPHLGGRDSRRMPTEALLHTPLERHLPSVSP
jgi:hypothetical protein